MNPHDFDPGSRPSGILTQSSGFNVGKFLAITLGLALVGGGGYGAYAYLSSRDDDAPDEDPQPEPAGSTGGANAADAPREDVPPPQRVGPKKDVPPVDEARDSSPRLDVPNPWGAGGGGGGGGGDGDGGDDGVDTEQPDWL